MSSSQKTSMFSVLIIGMILGVAFCFLGFFMMTLAFSKSDNTSNKEETNTEVNNVVNNNNQNNETNVNNEESNVTPVSDDSQISSFDLNQIESIGDNNKSEKSFKAYFNGKEHNIKLVYSLTKKLEYHADIYVELYIDDKMVDHIELDGGDMGNSDSRKIGGNIYIFNEKYLGFLNPRTGYGGRSLSFYNENGLIKDAFKNVRESDVIKTYDYLPIATKTGFFYTNTNDSFDASVEFNNNELTHWCFSADNSSDGTIYKISITFDGKNAIIRKVDQKSGISGAGQGGPYYSLEKNKYIGGY